MAQKQIKILLISNDKVGQSMAGPGIRYYELAKTLSNNFEVVLLVPDNCDIKTDSFEIISYNSKHASSSIAKHIMGVNYVIAQSLRPPLLRKIKQLNIKYIADLYDPLIIETLEYTRLDSERTQKNTFDFNYHTLMLQLNLADHILCSSDRQKDLYFGIMSAQKIITPNEYAKCPNLDNFISLLPFGLSDKEFTKSKPDSFEDKYKNIKPTDKIVYWGGGIWNWFDPLTVIKAIENISKKRNDIKLLFLGTKHPNPKIKEMEMVQTALDYCKGKDLLDKQVYFNFGWTPYEERVEYLSRANIGISTHFDNLETRFSFRTRILDYIWAELPMIVTEGDFMAELIEKYNLGRVIRYQNVNDIEKAIIEFADNPKLIEEIKLNIHKIKNEFTWKKLSEELTRLIDDNLIEQKNLSTLKFARLTFNFYLSGLKKKLFK